MAGTASFLARTFLASVAFVALAGCRSSGTDTRTATPELATSTTTATASGATATGATVAVARLGTNPGHAGRGTPLTAEPGHALAAFAEGCFWGSENTIRHVPGVTATAVGYTGGVTQSPTYEDVCAHGTRHAEAVLVEFDPVKVTYAQLLDVFFRSHDPTTSNRQGPDVGDQYRSAVFTFAAAQEAEARAAIAAETKRLSKSVTTEVAPIGAFWKAEEYHQQYDEKTGRESCPMPSRGAPG